MAEDITLAQVVRLVELARALPHDQFDVHFAASHFPEFLFDGLVAAHHVVETLPSEAAMRLLARGRRLYEEPVLDRYLQSELELLARVKPELVVGDFRLSLATSCELHGVPCGVLINAYWSPFHPRTAFPLPDHPIITWVGERLAQKYFPKALPRAFEHFAAPLNALRRKHGLAPVGSLQQALTYGDFVLYADTPELVPTKAPHSHRYLGVVDWQPRNGADDVSWGDSALPLIYVTLGSSGKRAMLPALLSALDDLPVRVLVATAGRGSGPAEHERRRVFDFVRGASVARVASLVITNGGSSTGYQALKAGAPVLGIPTNLDQYLASEVIEGVGAGITLPARNASSQEVLRHVQHALSSPALRLRAAEVASSIGRYDAAAIFRGWVRSVVA